MYTVIFDMSCLFKKCHKINYNRFYEKKLQKIIDINEKCSLLSRCDEPSVLLMAVIVVFHKVGEEVFNKAALINVGFKEAQQLGEFNCFIFHDVDLLPTNLCNVYECEAQPRHLAVAVNTLDYKCVFLHSYQATH